MKNGTILLLVGGAAAAGVAWYYLAGPGSGSGSSFGEKQQTVQPNLFHTTNPLATGINTPLSPLNLPGITPPVQFTKFGN